MLPLHPALLSQPDYLFSQIAAAAEEERKRHPHRRVISLGIGDVTQPIAPVAAAALRTAAAELAIALGSENLILLTDVRGLLRDPKDESTLIPLLPIDGVPALKQDGTISGGMIPKVDCCVRAIEQGVQRAFILDGRIPHSILIEMLTNQGIGTMLL